MPKRRAGRQERRKNQFSRASHQEIEALDAELLALIDREWAEGAAKAGPWLLCRPGCTSCCISPFPITWLDALRLRRGLLALEEQAPEIAARIKRDAATFLDTTSAFFPGNVTTGVLAPDEASQERFYYRFAELPCPLIELETGRCRLYAHRPISCRTFGLPISFGLEDLPPCELCFRGATDIQVKACRIEPDKGDREGAILRVLAGRQDPGAETLVAFALLLRPPP